MQLLLPIAALGAPLGGLLLAQATPVASPVAAPAGMSGGQVAAYIITALVGAGMGFGLVQLINHLRRRDADKEARDILDRANLEAVARRKEAEIEAKEVALKEKSRVEDEANKLRNELHDRDRQLDKREDALQQRDDQLGKQEKMVESNQRRLAEKTEDVNRRQKELDDLLDVERQTLHRLSGLSPEDARNQLLERLDKELAHEQGALIVKQQKAIEKACDVRAKELLITCIQRFAAAHTAEATTNTVDIPNDDMKGRIIGREGRNIRSFEKATGVDVIIDDTPGVVIVSAFDPVRREVARIALAKLITDGRIHPSRIEEVVAETEKEIDGKLQEYGEEAMQEVDVPGLHPKVITLLGRLRYRTSYSQNVLRHSIEVAFISGLIAEELGMDGDLARRAGLLHDIGKAADHDTEGGHPKIGADLLKRYGENEVVVHAALGHHDDIRPDMPYTVICAAADACSASRPGARRETLDRYIKRMQELESIATGFEGVHQAFAIQAGREVRVIANTKHTSDESAAKICRDIATAFEQQLTYPGEIRVTMIRESRFTETAK
ncbi:Ribonuclease Y [Posidoniimonas polymericola]|uniref:Ribonuclease Y n=1 Tax=Posidoniimonas polymericola TaxID=2528002 RepID=A0A5C5YSX0_9BACT|nr:ribonuclease Y [Posidoniimonas polymericola]TWT78028.1 Ribonuclease Y [Posidoniimonas polymericola]